MNRKFFLVLVVALIASVALNFVGRLNADSLLSTVFTINGIMFSIGLGIISNFNLQGIRRKQYIKSIRANINKVRNTFIMLFLASSVSFIAVNILPSEWPSEIKHFLIYGRDIKNILNIFSLLIMSYSTAYFIYNFMEIQKLSEDIFDRILEEKQENN